MGEYNTSLTESMSILGNYRVGLHNVGSYQVSGRPFVTGSNAHKVGTQAQFKFPMVTSRIQVANYSAPQGGAHGPHYATESEEIRITFNSGSLGGTNDLNAMKHDFILSGSVHQIEMNVKCTELYISAPNLGSNRKYRILAELTNIPKERMYALTGSGLTSEDPDVDTPASV
jgi:hypothetical protein